MQTLPYLFIFALALGAACENDPKEKEGAAEPSAPAADTTTAAASQSQQSAPNTETDTLYRISGTEPFWSLTVARPRSVYTSADGDTLFFDFKEAPTASARQQEYVQVLDLGKGQQLVLRKASSNCPCSDGMSGKSYPYQATLILPEKILDGCGRKPEAGN